VQFEPKQEAVSVTVPLVAVAVAELLPVVVTSVKVPELVPLLEAVAVAEEVLVPVKLTAFCFVHLVCVFRHTFEWFPDTVSAENSRCHDGSFPSISAIVGDDLNHEVQSSEATYNR
jgi:hypothetical protein